MKLVALIVLLLSPALASAETFEGVVNARIGSGEGARVVEATYQMRDGKLRMETRSAGTTEGSRSVVIMDPVAKTNYVLMPASKMYMLMPLNPAAVAGEGPAPEIVKTGRKEKIAGYECEHLLIKDKTGDFDAWVATALSAFAGAMGRDGGWSSALSHQQGFPLKVMRVGGATIMEVTKIEAKKLDPALFVVPPDYTRRDMPAGVPRAPKQ